MKIKPKSTDRYEKTPIFCKISLMLAGICSIIYIASLISERFADLFNFYIASFFRAALSRLTYVLPFSLAETLIITSPITLALLIRYILKYGCETPRATRVSFLCILSAASLFFSAFVLTIATGYQGSSLDKRLGLEVKSVSAQDLYVTSEYLVDKIDSLSDNVVYSSDGSSEMPCDMKEMNAELIKSFDRLAKDEQFIRNHKSRLKPIAMSEALSYAHVTGVYTFFTGEANINVNFPDYTIPFTAAHELAHQRGISREDEANMIAFLVCIGSDDEYIRYSGYLNMYEYVSAALHSADAELLKSIDARLLPQVKSELISYGAFFEKYENSTASKITGTVNDSYLKTQGTTGSKSYGLVVDLAVAYFKSRG